MTVVGGETGFGFPSTLAGSLGLEVAVLDFTRGFDPMTGAAAGFLLTVTEEGVLLGVVAVELTGLEIGLTGATGLAETVDFGAVEAEDTLVAGGLAAVDFTAVAVVPLGVVAFAVAGSVFGLLSLLFVVPVVNLPWLNDLIGPGGFDPLAVAFVAATGLTDFGAPTEAVFF